MPECSHISRVPRMHSPFAQKSFCYDGLRNNVVLYSRGGAQRRSHKPTRTRRHTDIQTIWQFDYLGHISGNQDLKKRLIKINEDGVSHRPMQNLHILVFQGYANPSKTVGMWIAYTSYTSWWTLSSILFFGNLHTIEKRDCVGLWETPS